MKKIIILTLLFISTTIMARTSLEQIDYNKPTIDPQYATDLALLFDEFADKYKVPANVLIAIAMVESSYKLGAINKRSNDFGIMQINSYNIKAYKFDKNRLLTDLRYSIEAGFIVFKWFYRTYPTLNHAIQAYNGGTAKDVMYWKSTKKYLKKVQKYM